LDAVAHGRVILSRIIISGFVPKLGTSVLDEALREVNEEHFSETAHKALFVLLRRYADQARGIMPRAVLEDFLRDQEPGRVLYYTELYDGLAAQRPTASEFRHSLAQLRELAADKRTGEALAQGMQILRGGVRGEKGEELRGHADARSYVLSAFAEVERAAVASSPEGDAGREARDILKAYAAAREHYVTGTIPGVSTGIPQLDKRLGGGIYRGQLVLVAAPTSAGKTAVCVQLGWDATVQQGKNLVYFTSETLREEVRQRLLARHSMLPKFGACSGSDPGLNTRDLRAGSLPEEKHALLRAVLTDWEGNPDYGRRYIVQVPRGATLPVLESRLAAISRQFIPDLVVIDYLALLRPERARRDRREDLSGILIDAKEAARSFGDGLGVPVVSPWQVSREGERAARENRHFSLSALAESAESSNSADIVLALLDLDPDDDSNGRRVPLQLDVLKNRSGERGGSLRLTADYATCAFTAQDQSASDRVVADLLS
jgi:replicative DNA helicase